MRDAQPDTIYLKDYQPPAWQITSVELDFELGEEGALVTSTLELQRSSDVPDDAELRLHGRDMELVSLRLDGVVLTSEKYTVSDSDLCISGAPRECVLECVTRLRPQDNTSLEGLYKSRTMFCTQCEAEGFRKITYYLDRPDVMSVFTVHITADSERYPVLLSNGNLIANEQLDNGRRRVSWHDPHPKPAYLFALVAGDLERIADEFTTMGGRHVDLHMYVEAKDLDKCGHAMDSLKRSMRWDEEVFGREYDLELFNIVAVDDFNMGAMENKSLNIFNTSCVLAHPDTTTDAGFQTVEAIVGHEYFHNWSGNRVTCRDWFQLSLKEGFTVYRDAEFSSDMASRTVKRVQDVNVLRSLQFPEDSGPMAHPVRPDSFIEISNFYTVTVYEKGAEVVRMIAQLLGPQNFRAGSDLYFDRHDGQAVTCDDFVNAMEAASGHDLAQFRRWYSQAGTPRLAVSDSWDEASGQYRLTVRQSCPPTPGQSEKAPFVIPLRLGLLGDGGNLPLRLDGIAPDPETADNTDMTLVVSEPEQSFNFTGLPERPIPALLRGFSAPVVLEYDYGDADLAALMSREADGFVRWDASQLLAERMIYRLQGDADADVGVFLDAVGQLLDDSSLDPAMVALMLQLPTESYLVERSAPADVQGLHTAREQLRILLGQRHAGVLAARYESFTTEQAYVPDADQIAARSLRNTALDYLCAANAQGLVLAQRQFAEAGNLTDRLAALKALVWGGSDTQRDEALASFYQRWQQEVLVVNQWLQVQALDPRPGAVDRVRTLMQHSDFELRNPNKVRAVVGGFANGNLANFHQPDGAGYSLLADVIIELDGMNPQIAARLLTPLTRWRKYAHGTETMREQLQRVLARDGLSPDVYEVASKSLGD